MVYAQSGDAAHREPGRLRVLLLAAAAAADRETHTDGNRHLCEVDAVGLVRQVASFEVQIRRAHCDIEAQATTKAHGALRLA